jgi:cob(I)alamin adenosyltransferase
VAILPELKAFILPGGTDAAAGLHLARTVCRRAERRTVLLAEHEDIGEFVVRYLNRLSDYLFTAARAANHAAGVSDVPWRS